MKLKFFIATMLVASILSCSHNVNKIEKIKILSFNIWDPNDVSFWEKHSGCYPVDKVVKYITEDNCDVLLLQEVSLENNTRNQSYLKIKSALKEKGYHYSNFYKPNYSTGSGQIGYYPGMQNSGYPLALFSKFPIQETYAVQKKNDKVMHKGILGVKIKVEDKELFLFNTHLGIGEPHQSEAVSKVVTPYINEVTENSAVIIAGDWNSPPEYEYPNFTTTIGKYTYSSNTTKSLIDAGFKEVYQEIKGRKNSPNSLTYPCSDSCLSRLDRFYIRNIQPKKMSLKVKPNLWEDIKLSDHRGVVFECEL